MWSGQGDTQWAGTMICRDFQIDHYLTCIKYQLHLAEMTYPSWPLRSHIGRKISQTPNFSRQHMGCARLSQKLKSPTKLTECALGAHTAKRVPHSPPRTGMSFLMVFFVGSGWIRFWWPACPGLWVWSSMWWAPNLEIKSSAKWKKVGSYDICSLRIAWS